MPTRSRFVRDLSRNNVSIELAQARNEKPSVPYGGPYAYFYGYNWRRGWQ